MQTFGRKTHLCRSLHSSISMWRCMSGWMQRLPLCNTEPADLCHGCAFTAAFGAALCVEHFCIQKWVQRLWNKQRLYFLRLWNKSVPSEQIGCCFQPSFHITVLRSQRDGKALEVLLLLLIFCNAGYVELTPTPWKSPGCLKIPLISFDLFLKDERVQQTYCHRIMHLPCFGFTLFLSLFSIGVVSVAKACICCSEKKLLDIFFSISTISFISLKPRCGQIDCCGVLFFVLFCILTLGFFKGTTQVIIRFWAYSKTCSKKSGRESLGVN